MFGYKIVKESYTPSDKLLDEIRDILFPQLILREEMQNDGTVIKYHVDYSIDSNLDAALIDLQDGHNDTATQKTVNSSIKKLGKVRRLLDAFAKLDEDAKYIIVDDGDPDAYEGISSRE